MLELLGIGLLRAAEAVGLMIEAEDTSPLHCPDRYATRDPTWKSDSMQLPQTQVAVLRTGKQSLPRDRRVVESMKEVMEYLKGKTNVLSRCNQRDTFSQTPSKFFVN